MLRHVARAAARWGATAARGYATESGAPAKGGVSMLGPRWVTIRWFACVPPGLAAGALWFSTQLPRRPALADAAGVPPWPAGVQPDCRAAAPTLARPPPPLQSSVPLFLGLAGAGVGRYYAKEQGMLDSFLGAAPGTNVSPQALPLADPCRLTPPGAAALLLVAPPCN